MTPSGQVTDAASRRRTPSDLLQVKDEFPEFDGADLGGISGVPTGLEEAPEGGERGSGYLYRLVSLALATGAEPVAVE